MNVIKVVDIADLAELCAELLKNGVTFVADKMGDGYWHVKLGGF